MRTETSHLSLLFGIVCLLLGAISIPLRGQEALEFQAGTDVVGLQLFVTDRDGQPVSGLGRDDFIVEDRGERVPVVAVREIDVAALSESGSQDVTRPLERRQFLLLFDLSFSSVPGLVRARHAALDFVSNRLEPSDLVAVATISAADGVRLLAGFTPDREQLTQAIETLGVVSPEATPGDVAAAHELGIARPGSPATLPTGDVSIETGGERASGVEAALREQLKQSVLDYARQNQQRYNQSVMSYLANLRAFVTELEWLRGRKEILLLSAGFDARALVGAGLRERTQSSSAVIAGRLWEVDPDAHFGGSVESRGSVRGLLEASAASDAVLHSIDVTGLAVGVGVDTASDRGAVGQGIESLSYMAHGSGGTVIKNTNDLASGLGQIALATSRYYVLAFEPGRWDDPGRFHELKVKLARTGLRVSHKAGYVEPRADLASTPFAQQLRATEAMVKGLEEGEYDVKALALPYRDVGGAIATAVIVQVGGDSLLAKPARSLRLEILGVALDERGATQDDVVIRPSLDVAVVGETLRRGGLQVFVTFQLPQGRSDLRFVVRELTTGRMGTTRVVVQATSMDSGTTLLYPPLFMSELEAWVRVRAPSRKSQTSDLPFGGNDAAFTAQLRPRLINGRTSRVCVMFSSIGPAPDPNAFFELLPEFVGATGEASLAPVELVDVIQGADGFRRFILDVTPQGLAEAEYSLRVSLTDPISDSAVVSEQLVTLR